jgi:hypothetical protein
MKPDSTTEDVRRAIKHKFAFFAAGDEGEKGTFNAILNLKYIFRQ